MAQKKAKHINPVLEALASAGVDDEPLTAEEKKDIAESRKEFAQKKQLSSAQLKRVLEIV
jgi:hypothetical protein